MIRKSALLQMFVVGVVGVVVGFAVMALSSTDAPDFIPLWLSVEPIGLGIIYLGGGIVFLTGILAIARESQKNQRRFNRQRLAAVPLEKVR